MKKFPAFRIVSFDGKLSKIKKVNRNKREIMKNKGRFIAAVQNDKKRTDQLEGILNEVLLLEQQIAIIKGLNENNTPWGAWETAREAQGKFNDDNELLKLSVELSEKVSSFVRVIKRAEKLENENLIKKDQYMYYSYALRYRTGVALTRETAKRNRDSGSQQ